MASKRQQYIANLIRPSMVVACARFRISRKTIDEAANLAAFRLLSSRGKAAPDFRPDALPEHAPELYSDRPVIDGCRRETTVEFVRRVWSPWIKAGLICRSDFHALDTNLHKAIANWIRHHGGLPEDIKLPTQTGRPRLDRAVLSNSNKHKL